MRGLLGTGLLLAALAAGALAVGWASMKAAGAEVDWAPAGRANTVSGYTAAAVLGLVALAAAVAGTLVLRGGRDRRPTP